MYNRYTPQSDGSYRRDKMPDRSPQPPQHRPQPQAQPYYPPQPEVPPCPLPVPEVPSCPPPNPFPCSTPPQSGITGFLRQFLPQNFDTGDLLIILLLLLMAGDNEEEKGTALLTLAFYLFM